MAHPLNIPSYRANPGTPWAPLTPSELEARRLVQVHAENVTNTTSTDFPGHYGPAQDDSWNLQTFHRNFRVQFHHNKPHDAAFSLVGIDASVANAFRRILIAEIPTLAIEDVFVFDNTSIIQDEVLAHRLGLIPLAGNPEAIKSMRWFKKPPPKDAFHTSTTTAHADDPTNTDLQETSEQTSTAPNDFNTIVLHLNISCRWATTAEDGRDGRALARADPSIPPEQKYVNSNVYARDLVFEPMGSQGEAERFGAADSEGAVRPVNPDILIAKLRPGQKISLRCHCVKGLGSDHAKFSPVATASYRLLPSIQILSPIVGADAKKFARCFPRGVIGYEHAKTDDGEGEVRAVVKDVMKDSVSRECLRHEEFQGKVKLGRVRDHFVFSVESTGQFESDELFLDAVRVLRGKAERFRRMLGELEEGR